MDLALVPQPSLGSSLHNLGTSRVPWIYVIVFIAVTWHLSEFNARFTASGGFPIP